MSTKSIINEIDEVADEVQSILDELHQIVKQDGIREKLISLLE
jgi:hypothetical protein